MPAIKISVFTYVDNRYPLPRRKSCFIIYTRPVRSQIRNQETRFSNLLKYPLIYPIIMFLLVNSHGFISKTLYRNLNAITINAFH